MKKSGFTLVELSIVLVIVGLLVGGILVGQSLVDSAKIGAQIRQLSQFDIAYDNFIGRFKQIPGDSNYFQDQGDNDGIIENDKSTGATTFMPQQTEEAANFWKHLSDAKMLSQTYTAEENATTPFTYNAGISTPESELDDSTVVTINSFTPILGTHAGTTFTSFVLSDATTDSGVYSAGVRPVDALAIDSKLDDGISSFTADDINNKVKNLYTASDTCSSSTDGTYLVDNKERVCILSVSLGTASGWSN